ncbi:MAG: hypothetical protein DCC75_01260 [Proteobacteria bacterium]|nr:MAG: hypothetical protein DCC75_01260 [Pseudomonadota bacterium]
MCGRAYSTFSDEELYFRYLNRKIWPWPVETKALEIRPNYNMCPTQTAPVVCVSEGRLCVLPMRWGLVPGWAKSVKDADKYSMINARSEEIAEKRSYKAALQKRRCIVPVSGFFEWKREAGANKRPFAVSLKGEPIMGIAGIYEHWVSKESEEVVDSFALVTTAANSFMKEIHDRMPVILGEEDEEGWLDPANSDPASVVKFMKSCPSEWLDSYEVSKAVNSPRNNSPQVLLKLSA